MTYTIWSSGGRHEWILRDGEDIVARSGLVFATRSQAKSALNKKLREMGL